MKLEVYFDYACPFCKRGHEDLTGLLPEFPQVEVVWKPCEAHPRPERHEPHSDLCARGMYILQERGAALESYHTRMYKAAVSDRQNTDDIGVITGAASGLIDPDALALALRSDVYQAELDENNRVAWDEYGFDAVPSFVMDGKTLRSPVGVGLTQDDMRKFLQA